MRFLIRLILLVVAFLLLRSLLEPVIKAVAGMFSPSSPPPQAPGAAPPGIKSAELKKDPVCGTFIAPELAIVQKFNGQVIHFCSQKCRDAYAAAHKG